MKKNNALRDLLLTDAAYRLRCERLGRPDRYMDPLIELNKNIYMTGGAHTAEAEELMRSFLNVSVGNAQEIAFRKGFDYACELMGRDKVFDLEEEER